MNRDKARPVLLVEDNPDDIELARIAFEQAGIWDVLDVVRDGVEALAYIRAKGGFHPAELPAVVLLDLHLPKKSGFELLREMKTDPELKSVPVIVLTGSDLDQDTLKNYNCNPDGFLKKPLDAESFLSLARKLGGFPK